MVKMYMSFVNEHLLNDQRLKLHSLGIGRLLSEHLRAVQIIRETQEDINLEFDAHIETFTNDLKRNNRIRARVAEWLSERVQIEKVKRGGKALTVV